MKTLKQIPKGHVRVEVRSSAQDEGHIFATATIPASEVGDIIGAMLVRNVKKPRKPRHADNQEPQA